MKELSLYKNDFEHITPDYWKKYKELFDYIDTFFLDTFRGVDLILLSNIRKYFVKDRFTAGGLNITYINKSKKSKVLFLEKYGIFYKISDENYANINVKHKLKHLHFHSHFIYRRLKISF
jgi:hypothetical protein